MAEMMRLEVGILWSSVLDLLSEKKRVMIVMDEDRTVPESQMDTQVSTFKEAIFPD